MRERALVTGASGGFGLEFARLLAADGYDLILVARSRDRLEAVADELRGGHDITVRVIAQDLAVVNAARAVFEQVAEVDVLINNAGFASHGAFAQLDERRILEELNLDIVALTQLTRLYLPQMLRRGHGKILNVASTAAYVPGPFMAVYYAAKAYVLSFSQALTEELRGTGVSVTCVNPGATATGFQERAGMQRSMLARLPLGNAAKVARAGYRAMQRGDDVVVPGPVSNWLVPLARRWLPRRTLLWLSRRAAEIR
jgi:short-subunit dehydrogenase